MNIIVNEIRIRNYRSLKDVSLCFDDCTVLVGKNNCGKSNIMQAIKLAFNFSNGSREDYYVSVEDPFDIHNKIQIDIKISPVNNSGVIQKGFNNVWSRSFGGEISLDAESDMEFFAFRTEIVFDEDKEIFQNNKYKIDAWSKFGESKRGSKISRDVLDGIDAIFVDAQRDISLDLKDKRSVWGKMASKIKVSDESANIIQTQLTKLNKKIVSESEILQGINVQLKETTGERKSIIEINPITKNIESLYKGMDIYYTDSDSLPISVDNLGLGVRSWAVFSTVKAETLFRTAKEEREEQAYHPFILVEEPEAHIHPQAQRQIYSAISEIVGQKIITTHSPYVLSQIDLSKVRYVKKDAAKTSVVPLMVDDLTKDEIRKIEKTVMNTRGEILYSNAVILVEGETEEQALPCFLREYFDKEPFELGINVVSVAGPNYLPFMRILDRLGIKWYIFSDGEPMPLGRDGARISEGLVR